jgi:hypothetical protein
MMQCFTGFSRLDVPKNLPWKFWPGKGIFPKKTAFLSDIRGSCHKHPLMPIIPGAEQDSYHSIKPLFAQ